MLAGHLLAVVGLASLFPAAGPSGGLGTAGLVVAVAAVLTVPVGGWLVAVGTAPLAAHIEEEHVGLPGAGRWIGWLERALVLLFVLADELAGIGFLVAAKSILRYADIREAGQRAVTEYIIIGTFLSVGWALLVGLAARWLLTML